MSREEAVSVFRLICRTLPRPFRDRYAKEMTEVFVEQIAEPVYCAKTQWFIHRSLIDVAWLSFEENFNLVVGLLAALVGISMMPAVVLPHVGSYYSVHEYFLDRAVGTLGLLLVLTAAFVSFWPRAARGLWKIVTIASLVVSGIYLWQMIDIFQLQIDNHIPVTLTEVLGFAPFVLLPPLLAAMVGRYLRWREKVVG